MRDVIVEILVTSYYRYIVREGSFVWLNNKSLLPLIQPSGISVRGSRLFSSGVLDTGYEGIRYGVRGY